MQENISNNFQTIIDVRKTLLHKVPSFSEFYQIFFPLIPKDKFHEFANNKDFQNFNDLVLSFAKDCSISNINSLSIDEYLKTAGYKVKLLEEFIKNYELELNLHLLLPYKKQYKRLFYFSVFEKNYPRILNKIFDYTNDEIIKNIKSNSNNKMVFVSHNLNVFFKLIRKNDIKIYFCNHFLSVLKKQNHENLLKIKSEVLKPDFEINILSQIPSVLKFINDQEKSSEKIINVGYFLMSKKSEEFSEKKILLSNFPIKMIPIDPRYELENKNFDIILHKITDILKFYGKYVDLAVSAKQNLINFYNKYKNEIIFVDPLDNLDVVYSRISFQNVFEKIFNSENFISLLEKINNKLTIKVPKMIEITEEDKKNIDLIKMKIEANKMTPPFIVKTVEALGDLKSHFMAVALDIDGIEIIEKHEIFKNEFHIIQEFVNHDETIFKIYVIANKTWIDQRQSLPNLSYSIFNANHFFFDSQTSFKDQLEFLQKRNQIDFKSFGIVLDPEIIQLMTKEISKELSFSFYGYDLIKKSGTNEIYIVDINYLPGFKCKKDLQNDFHEHFISLVRNKNEKYKI